MLAVELTLLLSEGVHEDGSTTQVIARGFFRDDFSGLQFAIKDSERFADEPRPPPFVTHLSNVGSCPFSVIRRAYIRYV